MEHLMGIPANPSGTMLASREFAQIVQKDCDRDIRALAETAQVTHAALGILYTGVWPTFCIVEYE